ncbi:ATP-binding protein [Piscinibacter defluvii]|uniref:ATP-binding protein n=1 Tax=Piscinibacter defluvii TaxID=1796922 RepID=UPI000FDDE536|nr:ATP-binding protein [Piscinibacter defluvii]
MSLQPPHSLRTRLLWFLLAAITLTAVVQAVIAYRTARSEADEIFDYHMQQMAMSLRSGLPLAGTVHDGEDRPDEEGYDFVVQVWTSDGLRVFQSAHAALPRRAALGFSNVQARGTTYRVFSMQAGPQIVQVAQDMAARQDMAGTLALRTLLPIALMAPLLMLLVWWVVSSSLAPVSRARRQVAERQADGLDEVSEAGLPDEIRPLVHELNLLFGRVRQAFDAQKNFVADAAHELRSPLAALKLQVQGLQRAADDDARGLAVARLNAGIDRAARLVEQLLLLARHQASAAGGQRPEPVALAALARQAVADAAPLAQARRIDLGVSRADEGELTGHPDALRILLRNLLDNAIKYTPEGGVVDVEVHVGSGGTLLTIDDTGPGIPEADRQRVLDRFYRIAGAAATGSGLGLAIVKSIAELHGATLTLGRSERLGGLRVEVCFERDAVMPGRR